MARGCLVVAKDGLVVARGDLVVAWYGQRGLGRGLVVARRGPGSCQRWLGSGQRGLGSGLVVAQGGLVVAW